MTKTYRVGGVDVRALSGIDLDMEAGEMVGIMGPSGSGKSTLLHLIGALDTPTSGSVQIDGVELGGMSRRELAAFRSRRVGFVFQAFNLMPQLSAAENVALPAVLAGLSRADIDERVARLLSSCGLDDQRDRLPAKLSGGEQQRVAVARALVMEPAVLLADEPTGSLDSASAAAVLDLLSRSHAQGQTIVLVTHDPVVASRAERVMHMRDGQFAEASHLWHPNPKPIRELIDTGDA